MRYPASEKLKIIGTVDASHLPAKRTLATLDIPSSTFYRWYDYYLDGGFEALQDRSPKPKSVWNRVPDDKREQIIDIDLVSSKAQSFFDKCKTCRLAANRAFGDRRWSMLPFIFQISDYAKPAIGNGFDD